MLTAPHAIMTLQTTGAIAPHVQQGRHQGMGDHVLLVAQLPSVLLSTLIV